MRPPCVAVTPQSFELVLEQIDRQQGMVGGQQLVELDGLLRRHVVPVAQQQPARGLDHPPRRPVLAQPVGFVHPHPVDHLAAVLGHHVEQVIDHLRVRAVLLHLQVVGGVHVHRHRTQPCAAFRAQQLEEWAYLGAAAATPHPQHPLALGVDHHRGVAVALLDRKLIHRDHRHARQVDRPQRSLQVPEVDRLDRLPVQPEPACRLQDRGHRAQPGHALGQSPGHPGVRIQPVQLLQPRTAARACQPQPLDLQLHRILEHRQVADPANHAVVDRRHRLATTAAAVNVAGHRRQLQHQPAALSAALMPPVFHPIPHPATQLGNTIPVGHGRPLFVVSTTTN